MIHPEFIAMCFYFEHRGKESGVVRFTFKMIEGLKIVEEEEAADSQE